MATSWLAKRQVTYLPSESIVLTTEFPLIVASNFGWAGFVEW